MKHCSVREQCRPTHDELIWRRVSVIYFDGFGFLFARLADLRVLNGIEMAASWSRSRAGRGDIRRRWRLGGSVYTSSAEEK